MEGQGEAPPKPAIEGVSTPTTPPEQKIKPQLPLKERLKNAGKWFWEAIDATGGKIKVEEGRSGVAYAIINREVGPDNDSPWTLTSLLRNMGYREKDADYGDVRQVLRRELTDMQRDDLINAEARGEPNFDNERIIYSANNLKELERLALERKRNRK